MTYIQLTDELCARRQKRRKKTRSARSNRMRRWTSFESFDGRGRKKHIQYPLQYGNNLLRHKAFFFIFTLLSRNDRPPKKKNYRNCLGRTSGDVNGSCSQLLGTFFFLRTWKIKAKTNLLAKRNRDPERSGV